jgi:hypothetical protein
MRAMKRKGEAKRAAFVRERRAVLYGRMLEEGTSPRASAAGPVSAAVKRHDKATQALIDAALRQRGLK